MPSPTPRLAPVPDAPRPATISPSTLAAWLTALLKCRTAPDFVGLLDMAARDGLTPAELAALVRLARGEP